MWFFRPGARLPPVVPFGVVPLLFSNTPQTGIQGLDQLDLSESLSSSDLGSSMRIAAIDPLLR